MNFKFLFAQFANIGIKDADLAGISRFIHYSYDDCIHLKQHLDLKLKLFD